MAVEFRHPDWWREDRREHTAALLRDLGATAVAVDTAEGLPLSMPAVTPVTSSRLAVVHFHGRSAAWGTGTKEDRFRHSSTREELAAWLPRLRFWRTGPSSCTSCSTTAAVTPRYAPPRRCAVCWEDPAATVRIPLPQWRVGAHAVTA